MNSDPEVISQNNSVSRLGLLVFFLVFSGEEGPGDSRVAEHTWYRGQTVAGWIERPNGKVFKRFFCVDVYGCSKQKDTGRHEEPGQVKGSRKQEAEVTRATSSTRLVYLSSGQILPRPDNIPVKDNVPAKSGRTKQP